MLNYTIYKAILLPHPKYCLKAVKTNIFKFWSFAYKNRQKILWLLLPDWAFCEVLSNDLSQISSWQSPF